MPTVVICGLGEVGAWALEFLARSTRVERIVTLQRSTPSRPSRASLAAIGAVFQENFVRCEHMTGDIMDVATTAKLLRELDPDVILNTATLQSPRRLMVASVDPDVRSVLRRATFGMWLPWHLLPATRLTEAVLEAGVDAPIVNIAFPDVVNPAIWKRLGFGPLLGAGNAEVSAAILSHYIASQWQVSLADVRVALIGSHAFFTHGPEVPHLARAWVKGEDVTDSIDVEGILTSYPEPIDWTRTSTFSIFAASAVKNVVGLLSTTPRYMHVAAPNGMPGSYPAHVSAEAVELALPPEVTVEEAMAINTAGNSYDGIEGIAEDGTVNFTIQTIAAMKELGYDGAHVRFDELEERAKELSRLFTEFTK